MKEIALENSTNTHKIKADKIEVFHDNIGTVGLEVKGEGIVHHGEHGSFKTETPFVIKYVQQEVNPITKKIEDAND